MTSDVLAGRGRSESGTAPGKRPGKRRNRLRRRRLIALSAQALLAAAILAFWETFSGPSGASGKLIDEFYVSRPSLIWKAIQGWSGQGILWPSIMATIQVTLLGFAIGAVIGMAGGFILGVNRLLADIASPFISALYSIPRLALVPLFMLWFGIGIGSKLALVASVVVFLVFYATFAGVRDVDTELLDKLKLMRAKRRHVHLKVTLPSAAAHIISGLSISGPYALVVAVTAEMFSSNRGLGYLLVRSSSQFYTPGVFAAIVIMMILGILLMVITQGLEAWLLRWKPSRERA